MPTCYLVRYGVMRHVGRFDAAPDGPPPAPGDRVVIRTLRGLEIGEVLAVRDQVDNAGESSALLRPATRADLDALRRAEAARPGHLHACERIFRQGTWPIDLIDVESLPDLDEQRGRVVLNYLGPHRLDAAGLVAAVREACHLDLAFEPVGLDLDPDEATPGDQPDGDPGCGTGGCGSCGEGGGCGTRTDAGQAACGSCGLKSVVRRRAANQPS